MRIEAKIILECRNEKEAKAVAEAISPDNVEYPELSIKTYSEDNRIITMISCGKIGTFITTVDDLLRCVSIAEKTVNLVNLVEKEE